MKKEQGRLISEHSQGRLLRNVCRLEIFMFVGLGFF